MAQVINTNILSLTSQRNLNKSASALQTSMQRLSSGLRINSAKDDAAGLAISERFTTQIRGLDQAVRNANDGVSFAQTAEGALSTVGESLQRIRELAVQSINDTNSSSDRQALNNEVNQLISEINRVANSTQFNGQNILNGSLSNLTFQVGANQNQTITVEGVDARGSQLGAETVDSVGLTATGLTTTLATNDVTINGVAVDLSGVIGATEGRVEDVVAAINAVSSTSGVQAFKQSTTVTDDVTYTQGTGGSVSINGVSISLDNVDRDTAVAEINKFTAQTGVTATAGSGASEIVFSNSDGSDIEIDGTVVFADETYQAGIKLATDVGGTIAVQGTNIAALGLTAGTQTTNSFALNEVSVLTADKANDALLTLDIALQQVNGLRAELGAVQTRFESTISNLEVTAENMTAARSRIRDADFAKETAELTRVQILQQAGISMLAQANAQPQNVLALLQ